MLLLLFYNKDNNNLLDLFEIDKDYNKEVVVVYKLVVVADMSLVVVADMSLVVVDIKLVVVDI